MKEVIGKKFGVLLQVLKTNQTLSGRYYDYSKDLDETLTKRMMSGGFYGQIGMPVRLKDETVLSWMDRVSRRVDLLDATHVVTNAWIKQDKGKFAIVGDVDFFDHDALNLIESGTHQFGVRGSVLEHVLSDKLVNEIKDVVAFEIVESEKTWLQANAPKIDLFELPRHPLSWLHQFGVECEGDTSYPPVKGLYYHGDRYSTGHSGRPVPFDMSWFD